MREATFCVITIERNGGPGAEEKPKGGINFGSTRGEKVTAR